MRRAAAAAVRVVQPRLDQPRAVRARRRRGEAGARAEDGATARRRRSTRRSIGTRSPPSIPLCVRFLDDVIDQNRYPIPQIDEMTKQTRKIGLGVMGWADVLFQLAHPATTPTRRSRSAARVMSFIQEHADRASIELARGARRLPGVARLRSTTRRRATRAAARATATPRAPRSRRPARSASSPTAPAASSRRSRSRSCASTTSTARIRRRSRSCRR